MRSSVQKETTKSVIHEATCSGCAGCGQWRGTAEDGGGQRKPETNPLAQDAMKLDWIMPKSRRILLHLPDKQEGKHIIRKENFMQLTLKEYLFSFLIREPI